MSVQGRVIYIITKLELGGAQKVCLALHQDLAKNQIIATLVSGDEGVLVKEVAQQDHVILLKDFKREVGLKMFFSELRALYSLWRLLRYVVKKYPDIIVHTHSTKAGIMGRWAAFFAGVRHRIHTVHGFGFHDYQPFYVWIIIYCLEWITACVTTHFVCVSEKDRKEGILRLPFFEARSTIIRAAVDEEKYRVALKSSKKWHEGSKIVIGSIACFKPQKNLIDLLRAFYKLKHRFPISMQSHIFLEIIGDGEQRPLLESWITDYRMQDSVILHGWQDNVASFLHTWDIFALSSLWEGLPCAVVEARFARLPVVAYDVGGIKEIIQNGQNGYLVKPGDWRALSDRLFDLIHEQALYQKCITYADQLDTFHRTTMVQEHIKLYRSVLKNKSA